MASDRRLPRHRRPDLPPDGQCQGRRIDIPEDAGLSPWLEGLGLAHVGGPVAMLRGASNIPGSTNARIFALASQALG
jgi:hypothetical protein